MLFLFDAAQEPYSLGGLDKLACSEMEWSNIAALTEASGSADLVMQGTLSIKCTFGGEEVYHVGDRRHRLTDDRFLVLNCGDEYRSSVESTAGAESFCLFFHPRFVDDALRSRITPADRILDRPDDAPDMPLRFLDGTYSGNRPVFESVARLRTELKSRPRETVDGGHLHERFLGLIDELLVAHRDVAGRIAGLGRVRNVTRVELYRRLERARDFVEGNFRDPIRLDDIAAASWLSPHYLLRLFRRFYGETPHQYLTRLRIDYARRRLADTSDSVAQICYDTGFESPTSFTQLFGRHVGLSPRSFRASLRLHESPDNSNSQNQVRKNR